MYLNASTDSIEIILGGAVTANQLQWNVSWQDITSSGMSLPQSAGAGLTNNATLVTMVAAPAASTTRQVTQINVYNADTATATVTIRKDVSGTKYVLMRYALTTLDVLMWSREDGWRVMSLTGGGTTYTFSTGLTNTSGTVTANLSTGVAGGQSVVGGTAASNNLTLSSTSNATKGKILFGTSAYDEVNNRLGIGTASPGNSIDIAANLNSTIGVVAKNSSTGVSARTYIALNNDINAFAEYVLYGSNWSNAVYRNNGYIQTKNSFGFLTNADITSGGTAIITFTVGGYSNASAMTIASTGNVIINNGTTDAGFRLDVNGTARVQDNLTISDAKNIILGTSTGNKIGTATSQKLGFWNATPIAQPTTAVAAATRVGGGGTTLTDTDTFDGYTLAQVVKALRNAGLLA